MHKSLMMLIFVQFFSLSVSAEPLNMKIDATANYQDSAQPAQMPANSFEDLKIDEENDKSLVPVILSAGFLFMSLYGDNPQSGMYRAVGATATGISLSWYND